MLDLILVNNTYTNKSCFEDKLIFAIIFFIIRIITEIWINNFKCLQKDNTLFKLITINTFNILEEHIILNVE